MENLKNEAVELKKSIDSAIETKANEVATKSAEAIEATKAELNEALTKATTEANEKAEMLQKSIDDLKEMSTKNFNIGGQKRTELNEKFNDAVSDYHSKGKGVFNIKSVEELGMINKTFSSTPGAASAIYGDYRNTDIKFDPNYANRLRNVIPTGALGSDGSIRFTRELATTDFSNKGPKAKGTAQNAVVQNLEDVHIPVQTLQIFNSIPEEWMDDTAMIESYLSNRLMSELMDTEDEQILRGSGSGNNYQGINSNGRAFANAAAITSYVGSSIAGLFDSSNGANLFDVLTAAKAGLANTNYMADCVILNPLDVATLVLAKATTNEYVLQQTVTPAGSVQSFWNGLKIVETPAQTAGTFTILDSKKATQYWMREGVQIEFDRNGTDFAANSMSIRAKVRGNVTNYLSNGIVSDAISDWTTALDA